MSEMSLEHAGCWYRCWYRSSGHPSSMELELVAVGLHDRPGDERGLVELPNGWTLERGDPLIDDDGELVHVVELIPVEQPARIAALVRVRPVLELA